MRFTCLDLLPQTSSTLLRSLKMRDAFLNLLAFILENLIESHSMLWRKKQYHLFDPHLGESGCQSRALQLLLFTHEKRSAHACDQQFDYLLECQTHLQEKMTALQEQKETKCYFTLVDFLKSHDLLFLLDQHQKYIFCCYLLTKYKNVLSDAHSVIDISRMAKDAKISAKLAKKIVHYYQVMLTYFCCDNMVSYAKALGYSSSYVNLLKKMWRKDDDGRSQLPCYFLTEVIISKLKEACIPILIVLHHAHQTEAPILLCFHFDITLKSYRYRRALSDADKENPCFVINVETEQPLTSHRDKDNWIAEIEHRRLSRIILSYMAAHPQYSGKKLSMWRDSPFQLTDVLTQPLLAKRFKTDKKTGIATGCYLYNKSFFFIKHIFCDTYQHQVETYAIQNNIYAFRGNLTSWESLSNVL